MGETDVMNLIAASARPLCAKLCFQSSSLYPPVPNSQDLISPPIPQPLSTPAGAERGALNSPFGRVFEVNEFISSVKLGDLLELF